MRIRHLLPILASSSVIILIITLTILHPTPNIPNTSNTTTTQTTLTLTTQDKTLIHDFTHAMRDWGTNPLTDLKTLARQPAATVLTRLRFTIPDTNPLTNLTTLPTKRGPYAPNPACTISPQSYSCRTWPTSGVWMRAQTWALGSHWVNEPTIRVTDNRIHVTGTVRAIILGDDDRYTSENDWHALTPAWQDYPIDDQITIHNGKITAVISLNNDYWWINPYLLAWDDTVAANISQGQRVAIPVKGQPVMTLDHDLTTPVLRAPVSMGDLGGRVDWSLWNGLWHAY